MDTLPKNTLAGAMEKDPVCGMEVRPGQAVGGTSEYEGKTYNFCSSECKAKFDKNPKQFAAKQPAGSGK